MRLFASCVVFCWTLQTILGVNETFHTKDFVKVTRVNGDVKIDGKLSDVYNVSDFLSRELSDDFDENGLTKGILNGNEEDLSQERERHYLESILNVFSAKKVNLFLREKGSTISPMCTDKLNAYMLGLRNNQTWALKSKNIFKFRKGRELSNRSEFIDSDVTQ
ncbi:hypothetical protein RUM43_013845 [Polyplax serrata]|uniref:Uncharacterized protein n=1 Tax=Polyplax serrata TaxID=468196 RepID=A0AAN8S9L1_POLSC